MDEYNCGDCNRFYYIDELSGECSKHGCVNCMSKICKYFILNDMRKEDEGNEKDKFKKSSRTRYKKL